MTRKLIAIADSSSGMAIWENQTGFGNGNNHTGLDSLYSSINEYIESIDLTTYIDYISDNGGVTGFQCLLGTIPNIPIGVTLRISAGMYGIVTTPYWIYGVILSTDRINIFNYNETVIANTSNTFPYPYGANIYVDSSTPTTYTHIIPMSTNYSNPIPFITDNLVLSFNMSSNDNARIYAFDLIIQEQYNEKGSSGAKVGGSAINNVVLSNIAKGGAIVGPHHDPVYYFDIASGGVLVGGQGVKSYYYTSSGGAVLGGIEINHMNFNVKGTGGILANGTLVYSNPISHYPNSPQNSLPLITVSGNSDIRRTYYEISNGGAVVGGSVWLFSEIAQGGAKIGGFSIVDKVYKLPGIIRDLPIPGPPLINEYTDDPFYPMSMGYVEFDNLSINRGKTINYAELKIRCKLLDLGQVKQWATIEQNYPLGSINWTNMSNIEFNQGGFASTVGTSDTRISNYLMATGFGTFVGLNSYIAGIEVVITKYADNTASNHVKDCLVQLVVGGEPVGENKALPDDWPLYPGLPITYGSKWDTWGLDLTVGDINASDFGIAVSVDINTETTSTASIDEITITVYTSQLSGADDMTARVFGVVDNNPMSPLNWSLTYGASDVSLTPNETGYVYLNVTCAVQELIDRCDWNEIIKLHIFPTNTTADAPSILLKQKAEFYDFGQFSDANISVHPDLAGGKEFNIAKLNVWYDKINIYNNFGGDMTLIYLPEAITDIGRWDAS